MLALRGAGYRYPLTSGPALAGVDLEVGPGERVLLCGRSGCGKSTLLRLASGLLDRHGRGELSGEVRVDGREASTLMPAERAALLGYVGQDPADQLIAGTVADEVAFALEGQGLSPSEIDARVQVALERVGLTVDAHRDPRAMSGGQQQRLGIAAALAAGGRLLLLDEPLARLDPPGAGRLLAVLDRLAADGVAVILAEHRMARCLPWASRVVRLERGRVVHDGLPGETGAIADLLRPPPASRPAARLGEVALEVSDLQVRYGERLAVRYQGFSVRRGERVALVGPNGAGKSSLIGALSGRLGPRPAARVLEVPQDPDLALFSDTVRDELRYGPSEQRLPAPEVERRVDAVAGPLGLEGLLGRPPQGLSSGERLRVAVGAALTCEPEVLLLDEPTAGQDAGAVEGLLQALSAAAPDAAVVFATHDLELAEREAHRVIRMEPASDSDEATAGFRRHGGLDPRARLALLGAVGLLSVLVDRPLTLAALAGITGTVLFALPIGWTWRRRAAGIALALVWSTTLSQGLFYGEVPRSPLLHLGPLTLWREGLWHGLAQSLRLLSAAFAGVAVAVSTPTDRLVAALGAFRVPWSVGLLAAVALRSVPEVAAEWGAVRSARAQRGRPVFERAPWAWLALEARLLRPVAARALRRARALALSLDARGFDPVGRRSPRRPLRLDWRDVALVAPVWTAVLAVLVLEVAYRAYLAEALYIPALRPAYGWVRAWL